MPEGAQPAASETPVQGVLPGVEAQPVAPSTPTPATTTPSPAPVTSAGSGTDGLPGGSGKDPILEHFAQRDPALAQRFTDPKQVIDHLYDEARRQAARAQELAGFAPIAQQVAPYLGEFQAWRKQQEEARRTEAEKQKKWWSAPEYDPSWRHAVYQDPATGEMKVKAGYPPDTIQKLTAALQHQQTFLDKFSMDPVGAIRPGIEEVVREIASQLVQQQLGGHEETTQANEFVSQNASWLFTQDAAAPNGRKLSEWGQRFAHYASEAESLGLAGTQKIQTYAMGMVQRDYAAARLNALTAQTGTAAAAPAAPAVSVNDQHKQQFLAGAAQPPARQTPPSRGGASPAPGSSRVSGGDHRTQLTQLALDRARQSGLAVNGA